MADMRQCNRCGDRRPGGICRCGCPEFTLIRDPQLRLFACLVAFGLSGCARSPTALPLEDRVGVGVAMAFAAAQQPAAPAPEPVPDPPKPPRPGDVCPECEGRGKVSRDGRVWSACLPCKGTGRVQPQGQGAIEKPRTRIVYREVCDPRTGKCTMTPETEIIQ